MSYKKQFHYSIPTKIYFGPGIINELREVLEKLKGKESKVLILTMKGIPAIDKIKRIVEDANLKYEIFDEIEPNPSVETVERVAKEAKKIGCKIVIGVGGGSVIDTAKAAALVATNGGNVWDYTVDIQKGMVKPDNEVYPIIAIPTTAGTGAEVTQNSVITNKETSKKSPIRSLEICPKYAFVDPELTLSMPKNVTAATGFDAFTHAFEKALGPDDFPYIDILSIDAMKTVVKHLETAINNPNDINARSAIHWASTQGGLCVLAEAWESALHVFSLPLSAIADIPHGDALALSMPVVLSELSKIRPERVAALAEVFDIENNTNLFEICEEVEKEMNSWLKRIGLKYCLNDFGLNENDVKKIVNSIDFNRLNNSWQKEITFEEVSNLYRKIL